MSVNALRVQNVYKVFGRRPAEAVSKLREGASRSDVADLGTAAVIDASFEVQEGEIFVVMGLSGSGKSTLIRMLNGIWRPNGGHIHLGDDDLSEVSAARMREIRRTRVSMVFQHFALLPHRTVLDNAAYPLEIQRVPKGERMERANRSLEMVGLDGWGDKLPSQLSGGMRQRVGLARALTADTDVLLMDEAFSALDPLIRRDMQEQLIDLQQRLGKTIVFITHDLNEAMRLGDRIAVMRDGRIVQIGTAEQILSEPADDYVARFIADVDRTRVLQASSLMRKPTLTLRSTTGPRRALRELEEVQLAGAVVVDRDRKLLGTVVDEDLLQAQREGADTIEGVVRTLITPVTEDTPLVDLFAPSAESPVPLAVVDDQGRLSGVIPRVSLLEAMAPEDSPSSAPSPANGDTEITADEPEGAQTTTSAGGTR